MVKIKDTDYLYITARIRAMETGLLTKDKIERLLDVKTTEEAFKLLTEYGYGEFSTCTRDVLEQRLARKRDELFADLRRDAPDPLLLDAFCMKYDYHNVKALLKAEATDRDGKRLCVEAGRYPVQKLVQGILQGEKVDLSETLRTAAGNAKETLAQSGDPQLADFILDKAYFAEMLQVAESSGSAFLKGYIMLSIDAVNLRSTVRALRMQKSRDFLQDILLPGGHVSAEALLSAAFGGDLAARFSSTLLEEAAQLGVKAAKTGSLTLFEKRCDEAVARYLAKAKQVSFGEQPLIYYIYQKEAEMTALRIVISGRLAGLSADVIRERLREMHV